MFANFLNEIASHGFFIVANGPATGNQLEGQTTYRDLIKSMDWLKSPQAKNGTWTPASLPCLDSPAVAWRLDVIPKQFSYRKANSLSIKRPPTLG
jgi:hypothetical protein